jgi:uncharacterized protein (TIGR00255 family)
VVIAAWEMLPVLLSMTGHGEAQCVQNGTVVAVEVRAVNNRFLKVTVRTSEGYNSLEAEVEALVRRHMRRGTVQVNLRVEREPSVEDYRLNPVALRSYRQQLTDLCREDEAAAPVPWEALLALPGVVIETDARRIDTEADWPMIGQTLTAALESLSQMRSEEGAAMAADLLANGEAIATELASIEQRAPLVVAAYRDRLTDRINHLLQDYGVSIQPADVVREVGVFADRSDISEEIVRLRSHLDQFAATVRTEESNGRKLEFVVQEMLREANTIGSKANDAEITRHVVEIKTAIERMREMVQNVE